MSIAAKEIPEIARHKFYTEFDVVPMYSKVPDMVIQVSNALNIQVKDKVFTENFKSQLKNARANWIKKNCPCPKKGGAKYDAAFKELNQLLLYLQEIHMHGVIHFHCVLAARQHSL